MKALPILPEMARRGVPVAPGVAVSEPRHSLAAYERPFGATVTEQDGLDYVARAIAPDLASGEAVVRVERVHLKRVGRLQLCAVAYDVARAVAEGAR